MTTQAEIIASIESRACAGEVPIYIICAKAGVAPSTFYRWKDGAGANLTTIAKITAELDRMEAERMKGAQA